MDNEKFVIWGRNPVIEAIKSGRNLEKILIAHDSKFPKSLFKLAEENNIKIQKVPRKKVEELAGTKKTQGIVALVSPITYWEINKLLQKTIDEKGFLVFLDHITDPQNVGNIIRTSEVLGASGVVIPKERSAPINEVVVKGSAGAVFHIPISKVGSLRDTLEKFQKLGGWVVAIEKGGKPIHKLKFPFPVAIVLGSEGKGTSKSIIKMADIIATIPMKGKITSLNVASAGAIGIWEIAKQNWIEVEK
ncbi:23S rRNA (guanosine(2251)-2'-O)-methyltransferase RlmB [Hydrogenothermus marinus]|uniref:23S rRNA (Guanosine2251-2'-O)-methyltransferase n=1 Tax=Hydrogenothermus marinus TaxID=133270 RepID=A0A3M0BL21_9AQUI|nr:23S rRNA (guanosine(2251)-2'-O)-methyltransferase RlmB [Hydrogenothermus marinus]RMA97867.1 23S rRNA (guanosine2251-2'-O)-methyltransferase [Hydrogenothermus marinus]